MISKDKILKSIQLHKKQPNTVKPDIKPDIKPNLYLPWRGEFGWFCRFYVPMIEADKSLKYICHNKDKKHFFNNAIMIGNQDFDSSKFNIIDLNSYRLRSRDKMTKHLGHITFKSTYNMDIDIAIAPRQLPLKHAKDVRNWQYWQYLSDRLTQNKLKLASVGQKETTMKINGVLFNSWDFRDQELACLEIIHNAKLVIAMNSGIACMCNLFGIKCLIIKDRLYKRSLKYLRHPNIIISENIKYPNCVFKEVMNIIQ